MEKFIEDVNLKLTEQKMSDLLRLHLLDLVELESIIEIRKIYVEKIESGVYEKQDCLNFIYAEEDLLTKIQNKRAERHIQSDKNEIDFAIIESVKTFYRNTVAKHPEDYELWMGFYRFCRKFKLWGNGSELLEHLIRYHGDRHNVWIFAFEWDDQANNKKQSRAWLIAGLERHPDNIELNERYIKYELDTARAALEIKASLQSRSEKEIKFLMRGKGAEACYGKAKAVIFDQTFYLRLYRMLKTYPYASHLKEIVRKDLLDRFPESDDVWDIRARMPIEDANNPQTIDVDKGDIRQLRKMTNKERLLACTTLYQEAVSKVPTPKMWEYYLDFLVSIQSDNLFSSVSILRRKCWREGVDAAIEAKMLSSKHYLAYVKALSEHGQRKKKVQELLKQGTIAHPQCVELWHQRICFNLVRGEEQDGMLAFIEANLQLMKVPAKEILGIWNMAIHYMQTASEDKVEALYLTGLQLREDLAQLLKPLYLRWVFQMEGIGEARKLLENPKVVKTPCLEFYVTIAQYEQMQIEPCKKSIRNCYETACRHFGSENADLWCDYIKFESNMGDINKVQPLYDQARRVLNPQQKDIFENKCPSGIYSFNEENCIEN